MRETNKFIRRKLENKKRLDPYKERGEKRKNFVKPEKYRKQVFDHFIDEYYRKKEVTFDGLNPM